MQPDIEPILKMNEPYTPVPEDFEKAAESEKESFITKAKSVSYWADAWRRLRKNKVAMVALVVIIMLFLFAFIGPLFTNYSYSIQMRGEENWPPFWEKPSDSVLRKAEQDGVTFNKWLHPLGTDNLGRDNLTRLMYGTRISLSIGIVATLIVVIMRITEIIYSVPDILIVLLLSTALKATLTDYINSSTGWWPQFLNTLGGNLVGIFITFGLIYWVSMSRIIRGQVLMLKQQEYVTAARALGASSGRIIKRHLLPNCIGQLVVTACLQIPSAIFLESFLSFLGMGVSAPLTSLGSMASDGLSGLYTYPYRLVVPAVILSVLILSFNLFGDGLRDALDPRLKK